MREIIHLQTPRPHPSAVRCLGLMLGASLGACASFPAPQAFPGPSRRGNPWADPETSREWLAVGLAFVDRDGGSADPIQDSLGYVVEGGYELAAGAWRPALELGGAFSAHRVEGASRSDRIGLGRVSMGLRLTRFGAAVAPYLRVGGFHRWVADDALDIDVSREETNGWYAGCGLDFEVEPGLSLGPFVMRYDAGGSLAVEYLTGLSANFRL